MTSPFSADELSVILGQTSVRPRGILSRIFQCSCAIGGSAGLAHIGCLATPLSMTLAATSPALASLLPTVGSNVMLGISGLFSAAGMGAWWAIRGRKAGGIERAITSGGAALGLCFTLSMHGALPFLSQTPSHGAHVINQSERPLRFEDLTPQGQDIARDLIEARIPEQDAIRMASSICSSPPTTISNQSQRIAP